MKHIRKEGTEPEAWDYYRKLDKKRTEMRTRRLIQDLRIAINTVKAINMDLVEKQEEAYKYQHKSIDIYAISRSEKINKMLNEFNEKHAENYKNMVRFLHRYRETRRELQFYSKY